MIVYVVRHGESETNKNKTWTGWLDAPLTEKGREEAASIRWILSKTDFEKVYSSDLIRAKNTAEIAIPGCEYESLAELREINVGDLAGKPSSAVLDENNQPRNKDGYSVDE
jgi:broad specificity phosphatase PhoE